MSQQVIKWKYEMPWNTRVDRRAEENDLSIELAMIRAWGYRDYQGQKKGLGLAGHIIAAQRLLWPDKGWHRWNEGLIIPAIAQGGTTAVFGPASAAKTHEVSDFFLTFYFAHPRGFTCICSTTTTDMLDFRIFGQMKMRWKEAKERFPGLPGHVVSSKHMIVTDTGAAEDRDFRDGIKGVACVQGGVWRGLGNYVGIKNAIVALASDECALMEHGFLKAAANLKSNRRFFGVYTGNLSDLDNPLAEAAEPELGWDSLADTDKSRVYKTKYLNGRAVQLVGTDSPNFDYPVGREPFPYLIGREKIAELAHDYGTDTPLYNMYAKGKIPRDTMENRIITELVCKKFEAYEPVIWGSEPTTKLYCADISYTVEHGDRTVGMPLQFGKDMNDKWIVAQMEAPLVYNLTSEKSAGTPEEQIAIKLRAECERFGIEPEHVFFDGTGRSSFTSALMRLWSTRVNAVEFGGSATTRPNFLGRKYKDNNERKGAKKGELLPCNEVFGKLVTEFWFALRYAVEASQVRNLSESIVKDGHRRIWLLKDNNKMDVEPKKEMKERTGRSPDLTDCFVVGLEGARRLGFPLGRLADKDIARKSDAWLRQRSSEIREAYRGKELAYN